MEKLEIVAEKVLQKLISLQDKEFTKKYVSDKLLIDIRRIGDVFLVIEALNLIEKNNKCYRMPQSHDLIINYSLIMQDDFVPKYDGPLQQAAVDIINSCLPHAQPLPVLKAQFFKNRRFYDALNILLGLQIMKIEGKIVHLCRQLPWILSVNMDQVYLDDISQMKQLQTDELLRLAYSSSPNTQYAIQSMLPTPKNSQESQLTQDLPLITLIK